MVVIRLRCSLPAYHSKPSLICDFCPSDQRFAYSFLQIPPHGRHPCCLAIHFPLPGHVRDSHPLERAHGAQTKKTEDVQTPSVSSFGCSIFNAPSMAPSTIGKYCSGQSFNFCPTRWRSSLSSRMTSGLKYLSIGRPQIFTSCMMTGRLGIVPSFSMLARYLVSIFTFSAKSFRARFFAFRASFTSAPKVSKPGQSSTFAIQHHPHTFYIS